MRDARKKTAGADRAVRSRGFCRASISGDRSAFRGERLLRFAAFFAVAKDAGEHRCADERDTDQTVANDWSIGARISFRTLGDVYVGDTRFDELDYF